jgi:photosystem II stability/assembly factor-like uncharacterized protein
MRKIIFVFVFTLFINNYSLMNVYAQWIPTYLPISHPGSSVYSLAVIGNNIFAGTWTFGVFLSTDNGSTWSQTVLNNHNVYSLEVIGNNIYAGTDLNGVLLSTNNGTSWSQTSLNYRNVLSLAVNGNYIFAGTEYNGVYLSTNNGSTWSQTALNYHDVSSLAVNGNNIFAGTYGFGVYLSTDNGTTWSQTALNNRFVYSLVVNGNNIFAGTCIYGIYLSTDNGSTWFQTALYYSDVGSLAVNGNNIFAGTNLGVYLSKNNGANWVEKNQGFGTSLGGSSFIFANNYIFTGSGHIIWRRLLEDILEIENISLEIPKSFKLEQNYPNPFNPSTKIKFDIPSEGKSQKAKVKLLIYNILGKEIQTLVNEQLQPGSYEVTFDGGNLPSGVYFYKLYSGNFTETKKLILLK